MFTSRRCAVLVGAAVIAWTLAAFASPALATTVKGSPQPELKPITLAAKAANGGGSIAIAPSGALIAVYLGHSGSTDAAVVCVLPRAARACSHRTALRPAGAASVDGSPQVFAPSGKIVDVVLSAPPKGTYVYRSTDGGLTFGAPVLVGQLDVDQAEVVANQIVFSDADDRNGAEVESVPLNPTGAPGSIATASSQETPTITLGSYKSGVLVGNAGFDDDIVLSYAKAGTNFDASSSYTNIGRIHNEDLLAMSGDALLTQRTTGNDAVRLRIFNGTSFGAPHTVPDGTGPGPENYAMVKDPSGRTHVFTVLAKYNYGLYGETTTSGASWSGRQNFADAISDDDFVGALDRTGAGAVLGTAADEPVKVYPILPTQAVSFAMNKMSVHKGRSVHASGKISPATAGRKVTLQRFSAGLWHVVATTTATTSGRFGFRITASKTYTYRAVAADRVGFIQFGYSTQRHLKVTS